MHKIIVQSIRFKRITALLAFSRLILSRKIVPTKGSATLNFHQRDSGITCNFSWFQDSLKIPT